MDQNDRVWIESLFAKQAEQIQQQLDQRFAATEERFDQRFAAIEERFDQRFAAIEGLFERRLGAAEEWFEQRLDNVRVDFKQHVSKVTEDFDIKIAKLAEGHQVVIERLDRIEESLQDVNTKVDRVELRLIAHMSDVEAHHGVSRVRESALEYAAEIEREAADRGTKNADEEYVT